MITHKYSDRNKCYVFSNNGTYWALTPEQLLEMHKLTESLVSDAVLKICKQASKDENKQDKSK